MAEVSSRLGEELVRLLASRTVRDLTLTVAEDLPCWWPTHLPFQHKIWNWYTETSVGPVPLGSKYGPYQTRWLLLDEHTGTHFDAPSHFIPPAESGLPNAGATGTVTGDQVPIEQFLGRAKVIDCRELARNSDPGVSPPIRPEHIQRWEHEHGSLESGDVVLFRTDWDQFYLPGPAGRPYVEDVLIRRIHPGWPAPDVATAEYLLSKGVRCMGTDAPSMGAAHDGGPVHVAALSAGAVFIEGLTKLGTLPASGAFFMFLPIKIKDSTGGCGRAIAIS